MKFSKFLTLIRTSNRGKLSHFTHILLVLFVAVSCFNCENNINKVSKNHVLYVNADDVMYEADFESFKCMFGGKISKAQLDKNWLEFRKESIDFGINSRLEIAALWANIAKETNFLTRKREFCADYNNICPFDGYRTYPSGVPWCETPMEPGKTYYARGMLPITWHCNYEQVGMALGEDLVKNPDLLETNLAMAYKAAFFYWKYPRIGFISEVKRSMSQLAERGIFGGIVDRINGPEECNSFDTQADRVYLYQKARKCLEMDEEIDPRKLYCGSIEIPDRAEIEGRCLDYTVQGSDTLCLIANVTGISSCCNIPPQTIFDSNSLVDMAKKDIRVGQRLFVCNSAKLDENGEDASRRRRGALGRGALGRGAIGDGDFSIGSSVQNRIRNNAGYSHAGYSRHSNRPDISSITSQSEITALAVISDRDIESLNTRSKRSSFIRRRAAARYCLMADDAGKHKFVHNPGDVGTGTAFNYNYRTHFLHAWKTGYEADVMITVREPTTAWEVELMVKKPATVINVWGGLIEAMEPKILVRYNPGDGMRSAGSTISLRLAVSGNFSADAIQVMEMNSGVGEGAHAATMFKKVALMTYEVAEVAEPPEDVSDEDKKLILTIVPSIMGGVFLLMPVLFFFILRKESRQREEALLMYDMMSCSNFSGDSNSMNSDFSGGSGDSGESLGSGSSGSNYSHSSYSSSTGSYSSNGSMTDSQFSESQYSGNSQFSNGSSYTGSSLGSMASSGYGDDRGDNNSVDLNSMHSSGTLNSGNSVNSESTFVSGSSAGRTSNGSTKSYRSYVVRDNRGNLTHYNVDGSVQTHAASSTRNTNAGFNGDGFDNIGGPRYKTNEKFVSDVLDNIKPFR